MPLERMRCLIFEEDVLRFTTKTGKDVFASLDLEKNFIPKNLNSARNVGWGWTHIWLKYYLEF